MVMDIDSDPAEQHLPAMLRLPAELLHHIFSFLEAADVLTARTVCVQLGKIGAEHMLHEVICVYKRGRFQRLKDIAQHVTLSQQVKAFYFQAERFRTPPLSYEQWDNERSDCLPFAEYNIYHEWAGSNGRWDERSQRAFKRAHQRYDERKKGKHSWQEIREAYKCYLDVMKDQERIRNTAFDTECLTELFRACSKLEDITLTLGHGSKGGTDMQRTAFKDCMNFPGGGDASILDAGVDQFFSVINALIAAGRKPKRLTVDEVTWRIFKPEMLNQWSMSIIMSALKEFRLGIGCCDDELPGREDEIATEASVMIRNGVLRTWLAAASELRVLKLIMPMLEGGPAFLRTRDVIPQKTWPKLRELGLSDFETTEDDLVDLLLRHQDSLRRLSLSHMDLKEGEWESTFRRIGGKLPKLRKIKLRGSFLESGVSHLEFDIPGEGSACDPMCDTIEDFILYGGELPDFSDLLDEEIEWDNSEDGEGHGHEPPSRVDEEDAGYTSDGSVVSYGSDEFDKTI